MKFLKNSFLVLSLLLLLFVSFGCSNNTTDTESTDTDTTTDTVEENDATENEELGSLIGTWKTSGTVNEDNQDKTYEETIIFQEDNSFVLTYKQDGTLSDENPDNINMTISGTFTVDGNEVTMKTQMVDDLTQDNNDSDVDQQETDLSENFDNVTYTFTVTDDTLTLENEDEGIKLELTKES